MSFYTLGKFVVREGLRRDNPAFPTWLIYRGDKLIGKSFSRPDLGVCEYLQHQREQEARDAREAAKSKPHPYRNYPKRSA